MGLFNELAMPFEQEFRKAQEDDDKRAKNPVSIGIGWRASLAQAELLQAEQLHCL